MTEQNLISLLVGLALFVWIIGKQLTWQPVQPARMLRMPLILAAVGLVSLAQAHASGPTVVDAAAIAVELMMSLGFGALMGRLSVLRVADGTRRSDRSVAWETRTGWIGAALWIVLIAVRIGTEVGAAELGAHLAASTGVLLLVVAANRAARGLVILAQAGALDSRRGMMTR